MEITPKLSVTEDKIRLLTVKTDMFKTACLTLNVLVPMGEYAAEYAVLSSYLVHSSKKYDSLIKLNSRLESFTAHFCRAAFQDTARIIVYSFR